MAVMVRYDSEADTTQIELRPAAVVRAVDVIDGYVMVDVDALGNPVAIEILSAPADVDEAVYDALRERFPEMDSHSLRAVLAGKSPATA